MIKNLQTPPLVPRTRRRRHHGTTTTTTRRRSKQANPSRSHLPNFCTRSPPHSRTGVTSATRKALQLSSSRTTGKQRRNAAVLRCCVAEKALGIFDRARAHLTTSHQVLRPTPAVQFFTKEICFATKHANSSLQFPSSTTSFPV